MTDRGLDLGLMAVKTQNAARRPLKSLGLLTHYPVAGAAGTACVKRSHKHYCVMFLSNGTRAAVLWVT